MKITAKEATTEGRGQRRCHFYRLGLDTEKEEECGV
jgi:hypothetical protein